jgi:hypothetical protein
VYHSLMYRGIDKRRCISYLVLKGFGHQSKVASVYSTVASIEVAMLRDVAAIKHSCVAKDRLMVSRKADCLSSEAMREDHGPCCIH